MSGRIHPRGPLPAPEQFLEEMKWVLEEEERLDGALRDAIRATRRASIDRIPSLDKVGETYHKRYLQKCCVLYGLRLMPSGHFKGELPPSAIVAVRELERAAGRPLQAFHILAPERCFRVRGTVGELHVRISEDRYRLIHRWGRRPGWVDVIRAWPIRHPLNLIVLVLFVATAAALMAPTGMIAADPSARWLDPARLLVFFWTLMTLAAATGYWWFATGRRFSCDP